MYRDRAVPFKFWAAKEPSVASPTDRISMEKSTSTMEKPLLNGLRRRDFNVSIIGHRDGMGKALIRNLKARHRVAA